MCVLAKGMEDLMAGLNEALSWVGFRVDDVYGARVGRVEDVYVDQETGEPHWLLAKLGRFSEAHALIPLSDAVVGAGHVWVPYERDLIKSAPAMTLGAPLSQEREMGFCTHYGIARSGRGRQISQLAPGTMTAVTAASAGAARPAAARR